MTPSEGASHPSGPPRSLPEVWLRGPLPDVPGLLQPVAQSLLQCREEVRAVLDSILAEHAFISPQDAASVDFHIRHAAGSLDRLLTYARGEQLSRVQLDALLAEKQADESPGILERLWSTFDSEVEAALRQVRATSPGSLLEPRGVGRGGLPSTVIGLLFHAAEHTQRHVGQAVTTARVVGGV